MQRQNRRRLDASQRLSSALMKSRPIAIELPAALQCDDAEVVGRTFNYAASLEDRRFEESTDAGCQIRRRRCGRDGGTRHTGRCRASCYLAVGQSAGAEPAAASAFSRARRAEEIVVGVPHRRTARHHLGRRRWGLVLVDTPPGGAPHRHRVGQWPDRGRRYRHNAEIPRTRRDTAGR